MKILVINPILATPTSTGLQRLSTIRDTMIYGMCLGFRSIGAEPTLIAAADFRPQKADGDYDFPVIFLPTSAKKVFKPSLLPYMPSLTDWLKLHSGEFDLIISKECFSIATLQAARVAPEKLLIWQEMASHQRKFFKLPSRIWHNVVARTVMRKVKVAACSEKAKEFISRYLKNSSGNIVEHGIDSSKFFPIPFSRKGRVLITSSQLIERKNVASIIRKFARLHAMRGYDDISLVVAGDGDRRGALENLAKELGIAEKVEFTGFLQRDVLGQRIASAMAFLVDTKADLNVISIVESVAAGTPVVTNRIPLTASWIEREGLGIARDDWDAETLKEIIDNSPAYSKACEETAGSLSAPASAKALINIFFDDELI